MGIWEILYDGGSTDLTSGLFKATPTADSEEPRRRRICRAHLAQQLWKRGAGDALSVVCVQRSELAGPVVLGGGAAERVVADAAAGGVAGGNGVDGGIWGFGKKVEAVQEVRAATRNLRRLAYNEPKFGVPPKPLFTPCVGGVCFVMRVRAIWCPERFSMRSAPRDYVNQVTKSSNAFLDHGIRNA